MPDFSYLLCCIVVLQPVAEAGNEFFTLKVHLKFVNFDRVSIAQFELIQERDDFLKLVEHLRGFNLLAVDFEGEWNLHRYGLHLCLIQVSDGENISLIDPLTVGDLDPFLQIMEDPEIEIISHGPQSDIVLMDYLFGRQPRNVFDTEKAGQLLNYESTSLSYLLERHFGISKNMKVRVSDWNKRPLTEKMLNYAALDVQYLHQLRVTLEEELREKGRFEWQLEECKALEDIRHRKKENPHLEINRANKLSRKEGHILKYLYQTREKIAQDLDKPAYYIIPNSRLLELAQEPPASPQEWSTIKGVNPRIKRYAEDFFHAVETARETDEVPVRREPNPGQYFGLSKSAYFRLVDQKTQLLSLIRDQIKEDFDIYPMILSMRSLKKVAYGENTLDDMKGWQRKILLDKALEMNLDVSILMRQEKDVVS